jgi:hypothetical protein
LVSPSPRSTMKFIMTSITSPLNTSFYYMFRYSFKIISPSNFSKEIDECSRKVVTINSYFCSFIIPWENVLYNKNYDN